MNIKTITLDISKRSAVTPVLYLRQGDKSGTQLRVNVMRDGAAFPLGGYGVRFEMRAPKDRGYYECTGSANGNVATFTIDETYAAAFPGVTDVAYVRILEGSTVIVSTGNFRVVINEDGTEGADPNGAYTNGVTEWLEDATEQLNDVSWRAEAAIEAIGDISELAVPLMSTDVRGGAKLGHGLRISAERLGVQLVDGASGEASVGADGDYLHALAVHGKSVQDGTPTPDNPIEVRTVKGINLLPKAATYTENGITFTVNPDGSVKARGTATATAFLNIPSNEGFTLPAGTYTLSGTPSGYSGNAYMRVRNIDTSSYIADDTGNGATFTLSSAASVFALIRIAQGATINDTFYPQIERGTTAHDFVPCGALGLKVKGKNRLDYTGFVSATGYGLTISRKADTFAIKGTASVSGNSVLRIIGSTNAYEMLPAGTYTLSVSGDANFAHGAIEIQVIYDYGTSSYGYGYLVCGESLTFTASHAVNNVRVYINASANGRAMDGTFTLQIEAGSTATEHAPFVDSVTPIPLGGNVLASMPDGTHDELAIDDAGHCTLTKWTDGAVYDGSNDEGWNRATNRYVRAVPNIRRSSSNTEKANGMSNRLQGVTNNNTYSGILGFSFATNGDELYLSPPSDVFSAGGTAFQEWLAAKPVSIIYQLATPQTIDLGYIDMPKLSEGSTIELLATVDPPIDAEWWAVGAGAVHEAVAAQSERIAALESAIAELATL